MTREAFISAQNHLHRRINRCVNATGESRTNKLIGLLNPGIVQRAAATTIARDFSSLMDAIPPSATAETVIDIPVYDGANPHVLRMMDALKTLQHLLAGAYLHGSLATGEEIPYSDLDALVVLRDTTVADPSRLTTVAQALNHIRGPMIEYDPLQHHGWFVLTELDLHMHCLAYFPTVLFSYTRSLLPDTGRTLHISPRNSTEEFQTLFRTQVGAVLTSIQSEQLPRNLYGLKSVLSRILLLPALYLQARDGTMMYKKYSFDVAREDFPADVWAAMDAVSAVRQHWHYEMNMFRRWLLTRPLALRPVLIRYAAPPIPATIRRSLTPEFWAAIGRLIDAMQARIGV